MARIKKAGRVWPFFTWNHLSIRLTSVRFYLAFVAFAHLEWCTALPTFSSDCFPPCPLMSNVLAGRANYGLDWVAFSWLYEEERERERLCVVQTQKPKSFWLIALLTSPFKMALKMTLPLLPPLKEPSFFAMFTLEKEAFARLFISCQQRLIRRPWFPAEMALNAAVSS